MDDPANFEKLRQNFTTSLSIHGPNMNLPDMSEKLCELRDEIERLRVMAFKPKSEHVERCRCIQCVPF
jgi:hypothetical protein